MTHKLMHDYEYKELENGLTFYDNIIIGDEIYEQQHDKNDNDKIIYGSNPWYESRIQRYGFSYEGTLEDKTDMVNSVICQITETKRIVEKVNGTYKLVPKSRLQEIIRKDLEKEKKILFDEINDLIKERGEEVDQEEEVEDDIVPIVRPNITGDKCHSCKCDITDPMFLLPFYLDNTDEKGVPLGRKCEKCLSKYMIKTNEAYRILDHRMIQKPKEHEGVLANQQFMLQGSQGRQSVHWYQKMNKDPPRKAINNGILRDELEVAKLILNIQQKTHSMHREQQYKIGGEMISGKAIKYVTTIFDVHRLKVRKTIMGMNDKPKQIIGMSVLDYLLSTDLLLAVCYWSGPLAMLASNRYEQNGTTHGDATQHTLDILTRQRCGQYFDQDGYLIGTTSAAQSHPSYYRDGKHIGLKVAILERPKSAKHAKSLEKAMQCFCADKDYFPSFDSDPDQKRFLWDINGHRDCGGGGGGRSKRPYYYRNNHKVCLMYQSDPEKPIYHYETNTRLYLKLKKMRDDDAKERKAKKLSLEEINNLNEREQGEKRVEGVTSKLSGDDDNNEDTTERNNNRRSGGMNSDDDNKEDTTERNNDDNRRRGGIDGGDVLFANDNNKRRRVSIDDGKQKETSNDDTDDLRDFIFREVDMNLLAQDDDSDGEGEEDEDERLIKNIFFYRLKDSGITSLPELLKMVTTGGGIDDMKELKKKLKDLGVAKPKKFINLVISWTNNQGDQDNNGMHHTGEATRGRFHIHNNT